MSTWNSASGIFIPSSFLIGLSDKIEPIESQLEELLDELNNTLRPKIESPIRKKPILSIAIAAGIGLLIGTIITSGRK